MNVNWYNPEANLAFTLNQDLTIRNSQLHAIEKAIGVQKNWRDLTFVAAVTLSVITYLALDILSGFALTGTLIVIGTCASVALYKQSRVSTLETKYSGLRFLAEAQKKSNADYMRALSKIPFDTLSATESFSLFLDPDSPHKKSSFIDKMLNHFLSFQSAFSLYSFIPRRNSDPVTQIKSLVQELQSPQCKNTDEIVIKTTELHLSTYLSQEEYLETGLLGTPCFNSTMFGSCASVYSKDITPFLNYIQKQNENNIYVSFKNLEQNPNGNYQRLNGGLCTAFSLYAASQFSGLAEEKPKSLELKNIIGSAKEQLQNPEIMTLLAPQQYAFNQIYIKKNDTADFPLEKVKALVGTHGFKVSSASSMIDTNFSSSRKKDPAQFLAEVAKVVNELSVGLHFLRTLYPTDYNAKGEYYGHSMVFLNLESEKFLFDPNFGLIKLPKRLESVCLAQHLIYLNRLWSLENARFYKLSLA